jgi:transcriptional regulator with XRE-family HTH domain
MPSPAQLRAARVMLGLSQAEIAGRSCLSVPTVKRAEADVGVRVSDAVRAAITVVLKNAGVEFIDGDEPGVKLKRPPRYEGLRSDQLNADNDG